MTSSLSLGNLRLCLKHRQRACTLWNPVLIPLHSRGCAQPLLLKKQTKRIACIARIGILILNRIPKDANPLTEFEAEPQCSIGLAWKITHNELKWVKSRSSKIKFPSVRLILKTLLKNSIGSFQRILWFVELALHALETRIWLQSII